MTKKSSISFKAKIKAMLRRVIWRLFDEVDFFRERNADFHVTFNMRPKASSWGGGNQWLTVFIKFLRRSGVAVNLKPNSKTSLIFTVNTKGTQETTHSERVLNNITFGLETLENIEIPVVQRINDTDKHRSSNYIDSSFKKVNMTANYTIFISKWFKDYHSKWFDSSQKSSVIHLGADAEIFHPRGGQSGSHVKNFESSRTIGRATGARDFKNTRSLIASLTKVSFRMLSFGSWAMLRQKLNGKLCEEFRHAKERKWPTSFASAMFISQQRAGKMHYTEGAQRGLPVIYHNESGGISEVAQKWGIEFSTDLIKAVQDMQKHYFQLRQRLLTDLPDEKKMNEKYLKVLQRVAHSKNSEEVLVVES